MKIIKRETLNKKKIIRHTCEECNTVFEFEKVEAKLVPEFIPPFNSSPRNEIFYKIKCPVCKNMCCIDIN